MKAQITSKRIFRKKSKMRETVRLCFWYLDTHVAAVNLTFTMITQPCADPARKCFVRGVPTLTACFLVDEGE